MCELFGASSLGRVRVNELLKEFYSHSTAHPNGWGLAIFHGQSVNLEKEPLPANQSAYLRERLRRPLEVRNMIAHIRLATIGAVDFENCHPFVKRDRLGRTWTLAHNGTIFDCPALHPYFHIQEGRTDSERILCHIIAQIDAAQAAAERALTAEERFGLLDRLIGEIAPHNKVNLLIYDGELLYVHTNYADSLYVRQLGDTALFATVPLDGGDWRPMEFTTLCAYQDGRRRFRGVCHGWEYIDDPNDMKYIFVDASGL